MLSDKNLEKNLNLLRNDILQYKASKSDDNISESNEKSIKSITDLFLYNERILDFERREILIVELKAPKVKISRKELSQVMKYAGEIEKKGFFAKNIKFKILLISSEFNNDVEFEFKGRQKNKDNPYQYFENEHKNIEIQVLKWSDLIENLKRKLKYMSNMLQTRDIDVQEKAAKDFASIDFMKTTSSLKKISGST